MVHSSLRNLQHSINDIPHSDENAPQSPVPHKAARSPPRTAPKPRTAKTTKHRPRRQRKTDSLPKKALEGRDFPGGGPAGALGRKTLRLGLLQTEARVLRGRQPTEEKDSSAAHSLVCFPRGSKAPDLASFKPAIKANMAGSSEYVDLGTLLRVRRIQRRKKKSNFFGPRCTQG